MATKSVTSNKAKVTSKTTVDRLQSTAKKTISKSKAVKAVVGSQKSVSPLNVMAFTATGAKGAEISLNEAIFGLKENKQLLAQAVNVYLGNQRSAHAKTKTRAEINRTTAKVYKQKGTGGARHGSRRAPIYVGGGIAHGPSGMQNYDRTMSKALRSKALAVALSTKINSGQIMIADLDKIEPKTKNISQALKKMNISGKTLLVSGGNSLNLAARNMDGVNVVRAQELTAYHILQGKNVVITNDALKIIEGRFVKNA